MENEAGSPDGNPGMGDGGLVASGDGDTSASTNDGSIPTNCDGDVSYAGFAVPLFMDKCLPCHSADLVDAARLGAPLGVDFDSEAQIIAQAARILVRAVEQQTMPPTGPLSACDTQRLASYLADQGVTGCTPDCSARQCGDDGCAGTCGTCGPSELCEEGTGQCQAAPCVPSCVGRQCGDDGCGGTCGDCASGLACDASHSCVCAPNCSGKQCGDDGCGGSCGSCRGMLVCNTRAGQCSASCTPDCTGLACGDDGCGGSCGGCTGSDSCVSGQCVAVCVPDCTGKQCGDDGCGGSCGGCSGAQTCAQGTCAFAAKSWSTDVYPLLSGCGSNTCHGGMAPKAGLDLSTSAKAYAGMVAKPSSQCGSGSQLVQPGAPEGSYLINKLTGVGLCFGSRMPKGGSAFTTTQVDTIRAWIGAGALND